jgi:hypothetical protein
VKWVVKVFLRLPISKIAIQMRLEKFEIKMFAIEMVSKDDLQNDMLQMMLKRLLILCTRVYKEQTELTTFEKAIGYSTRIQLQQF